MKRCILDNAALTEWFSFYNIPFMHRYDNKLNNSFLFKILFKWRISSIIRSWLKFLLNDQGFDLQELNMYFKLGNSFPKRPKLQLCVFLPKTESSSTKDLNLFISIHLLNLLFLWSENTECFSYREFFRLWSAQPKVKINFMSLYVYTNSLLTSKEH